MNRKKALRMNRHNLKQRIELMRQTICILNRKTKAAAAKNRHLSIRHFCASGNFHNVFFASASTGSSTTKSSEPDLSESLSDKEPKNLKL